MIILKGQPIVAHLAFGSARFTGHGPRQRKDWGSAFDPKEEESRFNAGLRRLSDRLHQTFQIARKKMGEAEAQIFEAHRQMLEDPAFQDEIRLRISQWGYSAAGAVQAAIDLFRGRYARSTEDKIRLMAAELAGLGEDLLDELEEKERPAGAIGPMIDFVAQVTPRMVMRAQMENVVGFVASSGGPTAHATILARALEIPMVVNVPDWRGKVRDGDRTILDGTAGAVFVNPDKENDAIYRDIGERLAKARLELLANRDLPATTRDDCRIILQANISLTAETEEIERFGAEGVGLYRSELSYLLRNHYPTEEELTDIYRTLAEQLGAKPLTVRTLDVGGDKTPLYFGLRATRNPLLGLRSLRLLATHREVLQTQFRAILRASAATDNFRVMFPLIGSIEEWREAREAFFEAREQLRSAGHACQEDIPLGLMIELPSAALSARALLKEADFASIGTNDLTQYILGVDRNEGTVARLYRPISPPLLELLKRIIDAGRETGKPVSLCGELAGDPQYVPLLIGLGLRTLSMNPEAIPLVKNRVRQVGLRDCEQLAREALDETSVTGILKRIAAFGED
ncbi:MAG: phosphoenolpyruvate--protein phosphotransferase [Opitutales bacterium]